MSANLTPAEWKKAHTMARSLATEEADRNELGKALAYFRQSGDKAGFLVLLVSLPDSGFLRSGKTQGYFSTIVRACEEHLAGLDDKRALLVTGWAFRLCRWYSLPVSAREL
jgi:hypothetical protein